MFKSADDWVEDAEDRPVWVVVKVVGIIVLIALVVTAVVWGIRSQFSYWWGQQGVTIQQNDTGNIVESQAQFQRDYNAVVADRLKIKGAQASLDKWNQQHPGFQGNGTPFDPLAQQQQNDQQALQGLQTGCLNEVSDYNTAASSLLSGKWQDASLPPRLDPDTACDPSTPLPTH